MSSQFIVIKASPTGLVRLSVGNSRIINQKQNPIFRASLFGLKLDEGIIDIDYGKRQGLSEAEAYIPDSGY